VTAQPFQLLQGLRARQGGGAGGLRHATPSVSRLPLLPLDALARSKNGSPPRASEGHNAVILLSCLPCHACAECEVVVGGAATTLGSLARELGLELTEAQVQVDYSYWPAAHVLKVCVCVRGRGRGGWWCGGGGGGSCCSGSLPPLLWEPMRLDGWESAHEAGWLGVYP
jgi:hypothetical protein